MFILLPSWDMASLIIDVLQEKKSKILSPFLYNNVLDD